MELKESEEQTNKEITDTKFSVDKVDGFPDWIQLRSDDKYIVTDRKGNEYLFEDVPNKRITRVANRIKGNKANIDEMKFQLGLISEAMVEPKMGELEIDELPGSIVTRLKGAVMKIFDLDSFL